MMKSDRKNFSNVIDLKWIKSVLSDGFDLFMLRTCRENLGFAKTRSKIFQGI